MMPDWISFLATAPEPQLMAWQQDVMGFIELFDRHGQTVRCRAHAGPDFMDLGQWQKDLDAGVACGIETAEKQLTRAVEVARQHDVTIQRLVNERDQPEEYPVMFLASHGMKWERR